jgi:hypothetical protein
MSTPPAPRRSDRVRARPEAYADQQAGYLAHEEERALLNRAQRESQQCDVAESNEEESSEDEASSSSEEEEEGTENTSPNSEWSTDTHHVKLPPFSELFGSRLPRDRSHTILAYVQHFITEELAATIATNTNLYAASKQATAWVPTTTAEVWRFLAVHIFMGIVDLPSHHMYWEEEYRQPYVVNTFSRHRFEQLLRYFHIAEPTPTGTKHTVIDKIKPLHDLCLKTFPQYFVPGREFTLDETMVRFKGKSPWKTVIKGKPTPIGYKLYTLACLGYILTFHLYRGKGGYPKRQAIIHHTVTELVKPWEGSGRILYTDNLYTSPHLSEHLYRVGLLSCGTARPNRKGLPPDLKKTLGALKPGETRAWQKGQLGCLAWRDKRSILMLSTHHKVDQMVTFKQDRGPNRPPTVTKPKVALDYNVHKCHVDTADQLRQSYAMQRRSRKNWPSLAWWLLDVCIINAYTLWCLDTKADLTQLDFRQALLRELVDAYPIPHTHSEPTVPPHNPGPADGHWPGHSHRRGTCVHCTRGREGRRRSEVVCKGCGVHLCLEPCFEQYHREG